MITITEMDSLRLKTPCKINLHLRIRDRRPDGYHNLETVFALLDYGDGLELRLLPETGGQTAVQWDFLPPCAAFAEELAALPPEKNLVCRAAALFRAHTGFDRNVSLTVRKRVPPGTGLGGGSSNAAFTLFGLNALAGKPCSGETLRSLAARLGSDAPFFLCGAGAAWGTGRGEELEPLFSELPRCGVNLVFPPFQSATARAYALLDASRASLRGESAFPGKAEILAALGGNPACWPFSNDFLPVLDESAACGAILEALWQSGALFAGLSGSGSACFGVYGGTDEAEQAKPRLRAALRGKDCFIQSTFFLRFGG
jgi:4-diphosphocytidyl-2-C-methyl-D-erythritol kinase